MTNSSYLFCEQGEALVLKGLGVAQSAQQLYNAYNNDIHITYSSFLKIYFNLTMPTKPIISYAHFQATRPSTNKTTSTTNKTPNPARTLTTKDVTSVLQDARNIVFKREEDQWNVENPTSLHSPRISATTSFFQLDQRNMKRAAPVEIILPAQVQKNVNTNLQKKHMRMIFGGTAATKGNKKSADKNHHRMLISAPAGKKRKKGPQNNTLQNRFASRRSYIPMAQETPAMREVRIERHRKKQFSQKHIQHEQELLNKLKGKLN